MFKASLFKGSTSGSVITPDYLGSGYDLTPFNPHVVVTDNILTKLVCYLIGAPAVKDTLSTTVTNSVLHGFSAIHNPVIVDIFQFT